jgi:hypothetical protein
MAPSFKDVTSESVSLILVSLAALLARLVSDLSPFQRRTAIAQTLERLPTGAEKVHCRLWKVEEVLAANLTEGLDLIMVEESVRSVSQKGMERSVISVTGSAKAQPERAPREGGRPRTNDGPRGEGFRDRKSSPVAWGEGRPQGSQDGSRPPRREFQERPVVERAPTAAEQDNQWRSKMRPDAPAAKSSPVPSRDGSEAPSSPALAGALPVGRPKLNLTKRTVSEATDLPSPSSTPGDAKASPFGAARPIDTAAKEREIEEKRLATIREKKEAEEKAKEEKREAAKAAKAAEAEKQEAEVQKETPLRRRIRTVTLSMTSP